MILWALVISKGEGDNKWNWVLVILKWDGSSGMFPEDRMGVFRRTEASGETDPPTPSVRTKPG